MDVWIPRNRGSRLFWDEIMGGKLLLLKMMPRQYVWQFHSVYAINIVKQVCFHVIFDLIIRNEVFWWRELKKKHVFGHQERIYLSNASAPRWACYFTCIEDEHEAKNNVRILVAQNCNPTCWTFLFAVTAKSCRWQGLNLLVLSQWADQDPCWQWVSSTQTDFFFPWEGRGYFGSKVCHLVWLPMRNHGKASIDLVNDTTRDSKFTLFFAKFIDPTEGHE